MSELNVYELLNRKRRGAPLEPQEIETFMITTRAAPFLTTRCRRC